MHVAAKNAKLWYESEMCGMFRNLRLYFIFIREHMKVPK